MLGQGTTVVVWSCRRVESINREEGRNHPVGSGPRCAKGSQQINHQGPKLLDFSVGRAVYLNGAEKSAFSSPHYCQVC